MSDFRPDIWRLQANSDIPGLTDALRDSDPHIRKRAAAALRALGARQAVGALKAVLASEQDPDTRASILSALAALEGDDEDEPHQAAAPESMRKLTELDRLIDQLNSPDIKRVVDAAEKLGKLKSKRAVEPLVMVFNNTDRPSRVRLAAAEALLRLDSAPVEVALLGALRGKQWRVRRNGAAILGQMRASWAIEPLVEALQDEHEIVRRTAHAALIRINTPEALAALDAAGLPRTGLLKINTSKAKTRPIAERRRDAAESASTDTGDHDGEAETGDEGAPSDAPTGSTPSVDNAEDEGESNAAGETSADHRSNGAGEAADRPPDAAHGAAAVPDGDDSQPVVKHGPMPDVKTQKLRDRSGLPDMEPESSGRLIGEDEPTRPKRPANLVWPKKRSPSSDPNKQPTKPLDPRRLEEHHRRMNADPDNE